MADQELQQRCAALAGPVVELMGAVLSANTGSATAFSEVVRIAEEIRDVVGLGALGVDSTDYRSWIVGAPEVLERMIEAARARDAAAVWAAFADPEYGLHRVGVACAGQPGW